MPSTPHDSLNDAKMTFRSEAEFPLPVDFADVVDHLSDLTKSHAHEPWLASGRTPRAQEGERL